MINSTTMLENIYTISQQLYNEMCENGGVATANHAKIFTLLTEFGRTLVDADRASFWKWDKKKHELWTTAAVGTGRIIIPEGTGLVGKALLSGKAIVTNDPYNNPDFNSDVDKKTGYVTKSILVMPISDCKGEVIGAYQVINKNSDTGFDLEEDCRKLSLAAFICGITLESEIFLDDSHHDKLTGLKNRMGFASDFNSQFCPAMKKGQSVSMFICDIDFFKKFNDTYGHNAGDAVLKHVAGIFGDNCDENCEIYRWGGEEFIMLMKQTDLETAARKADSVRVAVQDSVCYFEDLELRVTLSFGCALLSETKSVEENIQVADENLYKAKEGGRNRVVF